MGAACYENYTASPVFSRAEESVPGTARRVVLYEGWFPKIIGESSTSS